MSAIILRRNRGIGFLDSILGVVNSIGDYANTAGQIAQTASMFGGDVGRIGSQVGSIISNYVNPIGGAINAAGSLVNNLLGGKANSQVSNYVSNTVSHVLGGDVGDFFGGLLGAGYSALDTGVNLVSNVAGALGVDTGSWFSDSALEGVCARPVVTIEGRQYDGRGPDRDGRAYVWHGCQNDHDDVVFQNNIERFLPGVGKPLWGRDYTRGLISGSTPNGMVGWQDYSLARWGDPSISEKDASYYSSGYATADIYNKHLQAMRRVRVPTGGVLLHIAQHGGMDIADAIEKPIKDVSAQDVQAMMAANALPTWLANEIALGTFVPLGDPLAPDLRNQIMVGRPNDYAGQESRPAQSPSTSSGQSAAAPQTSNSGGMGVVLLLAAGALIYLGGKK